MKNSGQKMKKELIFKKINFQMRLKIKDFKDFNYNF